MPTVLLDLNYTLAICDFEDKRPLARRIPTEEYRGWIVDLCKSVDATVILTTARPENWAMPTLERIADQLDGWSPDAVAFAQVGGMPPVKKEHNLKRIIEDFGQPQSDWIGFESNPRTRGVYTRYGIYSLPVPREGAWDTFPEIRPMQAPLAFG